MKISELYELGYAVPSYSINTDITTWRWYDDEYRIPPNSVKLIEIEGLPFSVAKVGEVRDAAVVSAEP